jgi:hypothetical protein
MQDATVQTLITTLLTGGPSGVIALLMLVIAGLLWDRRRIFSDESRKEQKLDVMFENYYKSSMSVSDALGSIKIVLAEISAKLIR